MLTTKTSIVFIVGLIVAISGMLACDGSTSPAPLVDASTDAADQVDASDAGGDSPACMGSGEQCDNPGVCCSNLCQITAGEPHGSCN